MKTILTLLCLVGLPMTLFATDGFTAWQIIPEEGAAYVPWGKLVGQFLTQTIIMGLITAISFAYARVEDLTEGTGARPNSMLLMFVPTLSLGMAIMRVTEFVPLNLITLCVIGLAVVLLLVILMNLFRKAVVPYLYATGITLLVVWQGVSLATWIFTAPMLLGLISGYVIVLLDSRRNAFLEGFVDV